MRITFKGNGVVWDVAREKNLCKFISVGYIEGVYQIGEYTTDNTRTIELLKDYPTVPVDAMEYYWKEKEKAEKADKKVEPKKKTVIKKKTEEK